MWPGSASNRARRRGPLDETAQWECRFKRGSGNVFRDLGHKNADAEPVQGDPARRNHQGARSGTLKRTRGARPHGIAAADFSRIRNADLGRFTVDRLMSIINRLGSRVEVEVRERPVAVQEARA
ncbi:MAG: XRE family transcriptional regulator [Acidobacteria bacterium]|nr:MAG: XRE family transcriptional regulator [Acidobacteriota bacterium]